MARDTSGMPTRSQIARAWLDYLMEHKELPWGGEERDWGEPSCWACHAYVQSWATGSLSAWDKARGLERCHVVPHALGGSDDPLNLVLMCAACHAASPDHSDPSHLYAWMRAQPKRIMGKWLPSHIEEMHRLANDAVQRMTEEEALAVMSDGAKEFYEGVGNHFGAISDGTRAALLGHIGKRLHGKAAS